MQINKETIEQLFRQHYLRMYQLARVLLKDDAASKDVVSVVFADVLDGKTQLELDNETITSDSPLPSTNAGSYLLVCVRHKCLNLLSRQKMKDREIATELGISEVAVYKHLAQGIRKLKQKFNP